MAVQARDGTWHHSATRAAMHDTMAPQTGKAPKPGRSEMGEKPMAAEKKMPGAMDIDDVVEKHGPAHHIEHTHSPESDTVKTVSHHGDGDMTHEAEHDNIHSAQLHAHKAAGHQHPEESQHSIEEHMAEHGPAHHAAYHFEEETGKHHVTTHHGDGDEAHHSVHDSAEDAHDHIGKAMDLKSGEDKDTEESAENRMTEREEKERGGEGGIPGIEA
jgi:hypothetical protein